MSTIKTLALAAISVFLPIKPVLITVFVLTLVDMVSGIIVALKKGQKVTSKGMGRTVLKLLVYEICIMCGFLAEKYLLEGSVPAVKLITGLIGATEMISVLENCDIISGSTLFSSVISLLQSRSNKDPESK